MSSPEYKYWAFISYAHADERWAGWLHRSLEGYRVPVRLVGRATPFGPIPKKLFPVFRDRDELAGSAALGPELQKALAASRALIVICSPRSARSRWVNEEIKYFKSLGRADRVFALIVDGEPHALEQGDPELECFPESLRFHVNAEGQIVGGSPVEPIAADARRHGDGRAHAKLKLIAGVLGIGFDDLRQRELHARNRRLAVVAGLATGVAALTLVLAIQAYYARDDARRRQRQAEDLIQFMLGDLRRNLEPIGKLDILGAVGDKAMEYFGSLDEQDVTDAVLQSRATALRQIGEVRSKQGNLEQASEAFREALKLDAELVARHPDDARSLFNVAQSQYYVGYGHYARGELAPAREWFEQQLASLQRLVSLEPVESKWQTELANAWGNIGGIAQLQGNVDEARGHFERALAIQRALVEREPDNAPYLLALADLHGWLVHIETGAGRHQLALQQAGLQNDLLRRVTTLQPEHADYRHRLAAGLLQAVYSRSELSALQPDAPELAEALALTSQLVELDSSNVTYARLQAVALSYLEDARVLHGRQAEARAVSERSLKLARDLFRRAPDSSEAIDDLLTVLIRAAKLARLEGDRVRARERIEEGLLVAGGAARERSPLRGLELELMGQWLAPDAATRASAGERARDWLQHVQELKMKPRAELMLRYHALAGETAEAERWAGELGAVERRHPYVRQFCRELNVRLPDATAAAAG